MVIVEINAVSYGSTAGIMYGIKRVAENDGHQVYTATSFVKRSQYNENSYIISGLFQKTIHIILSKLTGYNGCFSSLGTYRFLRKLDKIKPDIIHLHNIHGWFINLPMLFRYIKKNNIKTIWTLHDCWSFTGQCPYFIGIGCDKWKSGCFDCPQYRSYPGSYVDKTKTMYRLKKKWFTGVSDLTVVTPSEWLAGLVRQSFLGEYNVKVINNGIDLDVFKPTQSDLRQKFGLEGKTVLMGCAFPWSDRKGLDVFNALSQRLNEDYKIILVGVSKEQIENLPEKIIGIERTINKEELAKLYTMADIFINPTKEDNFPTVNIEALACGTPVITFNAGGSAEMLDADCGISVQTGDIEGLVKAITKFKTELPSTSSCVKQARNYEQHKKFQEYANIYKS